MLRSSSARLISDINEMQAVTKWIKIKGMDPKYTAKGFYISIMCCNYRTSRARLEKGVGESRTFWHDFRVEVRPIWLWSQISGACTLRGRHRVLQQLPNYICTAQMWLPNGMSCDRIYFKYLTNFECN